MSEEEPEMASIFIRMNRGPLTPKEEQEFKQDLARIVGCKPSDFQDSTFTTVKKSPTNEGLDELTP